MGDKDNLEGTEAIQKMRELAEKAHICMFATRLGKAPISIRPMNTTHIDSEGVWFFSKKSSEQNKHIKKNNRVQLIYSNTESSEFMSVFGHAEIITEPKKIEELWTPVLKSWFDDKDDKTITILKVIPEEGYYWDTKNNKAVHLIKMAIGAVIGVSSDDGLEGELKV